MISSLRNWASAVATWNLALDPAGGPVQPPDSGCGGCTGLITVDPQTRSYRPRRGLWQMAALSHFVFRGAVRIATNHFVHYRVNPTSRRATISHGLDDVAFRDPDGTLVLDLFDPSARPARFAVAWRHRWLTARARAGATLTLAWR